MSTFTIGAKPAIRLTFHSRSYGDDGWLESFAVDLLAVDFRVSVRVENPGYGHPPSQLLQELVPCWQGWEGKKHWSSMEGELEIAATSDHTGHITITVKIPEHANTATMWSAEARVLIEAGQLAAVAKEAEAFFAKRAA